VKLRGNLHRLKKEISMKRVGLFIGLFAGLVGFSQSTEVSSAGIAYKNYETAKAQANLEEALEELEDAKGFIDKAYVHPDTKDDPKCLMYYGQIYVEAAMLAAAGQAKSNPVINGIDVEKATTDGFAALKRCKEVDSKKKYSGFVDDYLKFYHSLFRGIGSAMYGEEKYFEAMGGLLGAAEFSDAMGEPDSAAWFYGAIAAFKIDSMAIAEKAFERCARLKYQVASSVYYWSQCLIKQGKTAEQGKMLAEMSVANPGSKDILIELINYYIDQDKKEEAEKALNAAIALDPTNPALIYTSGTIYENLDRFEDAETAYKKTIELDAKNVDAAFALGGLYFNKGADLNNEANKLPLGDANYEKLQAQSKEFFAKSIPYLESAYANTTDDVAIMTSLRDAYKKAGMNDKFLEMKAKVEALKAQ